ncbi:unnamed protein product [Dibothriocephalus latus]|uniref:Uncharacterized protein n=1 Tax=Dibothriocephalus latus TaxID=60516 RepID=A0A3P7NU33_DIBLA|nr:unnamed protein product [Dibothriocephalus latus]
MLSGSILDGSRIEVNWAKPADKSDGLRIQRSDTVTGSVNRNVEENLLLNLFNLSMKPQPSITNRGSQSVQMVGSCLPTTVGNLALPVVGGDGSSVLQASFAPTMLSNATALQQRTGTFAGQGSRVGETDTNNVNFFNKLLMTHLQGRMNNEQNERRIREAFIVSQILNGSKQPTSRMHSVMPNATKYQLGNSNDEPLPLDRELPPKLMTVSSIDPTKASFTLSYAPLYSNASAATEPMDFFTFAIRHKREDGSAADTCWVRETSDCEGSLQRFSQPLQLRDDNISKHIL